MFPTKLNTSQFPQLQVMMTLRQPCMEKVLGIISIIFISTHQLIPFLHEIHVLKHSCISTLFCCLTNF